MNSVPPKILPFSFGEAPFEAGQSTSVQCMVSVGDSPLSIDWAIDGIPLESSPERMISKVTGKLSLLSIEAVMARHAGNYTCRVVNAAGHSTHKARLLVNGLLDELYFLVFIILLCMFALPLHLFFMLLLCFSGLSTIHKLIMVSNG